MADLIQQHGKITGLLAGEACSSHVVAWLACAERFVYPHGAIGLHMVTYQYDQVLVDGRTALLIADEFNADDRRKADFLAARSIQSVGYWLDIIHDAGGLATKLFCADEIISMGLARPIGEFLGRRVVAE